MEIIIDFFHSFGRFYHSIHEFFTNFLSPRFFLMFLLSGHSTQLAIRIINTRDGHIIFEIISELGVSMEYTWWYSPHHRGELWWKEFTIIHTNTTDTCHLMNERFEVITANVCKASLHFVFFEILFVLFFHFKNVEKKKGFVFNIFDKKFHV